MKWNLERLWKIVLRPKSILMAWAQPWQLLKTIRHRGDCDNFVHVHIGEGIYTGVYMNGALYSGFNFGACNVGHHKVSTENVKCTCGKSGCFEAVASYSGIVTRFINKLEEKEINKLLEYIQYDLANVNADMIYNMALQGDQVAQQVIRDTGRYVGRGLGAIVNMINPEKYLSQVYMMPIIL